MDSRERATTPTTWTEPGRAPILRSIELVAARSVATRVRPARCRPRDNLGPVSEVAAFQERLFLPAPLQWAVRLGAVVMAGLVVYAAVTVPQSALNRTVGLAIGLGVTSLILVIHGVVEVTATELRVRLFPVWRKRVSLREVSALHRVEVNPLSEMGVLGVGQIDGATVLALRKGDAVQVTMRNGHKYTVGLQRPEGLLWPFGRCVPISS